MLGQHVAVVVVVDALRSARVHQLPTGQSDMQTRTQRERELLFSGRRHLVELQLREEEKMEKYS